MTSRHDPLSIPRAHVPAPGLRVIEDDVAAPDLGPAVVGHEILGGISAARTALETALRPATRPSVAIDLVERALGELRSIEDTLDELVHWAVGSAPLRLEPLGLRALIDDLIASAAVESQTVAFARPDDEVVVVGDRAAVRAAVRNVIANAQLHSPAGSSVSIHLHADARSVWIVVENEAAAASRSHGMGLSIVRRAVEAHGGSFDLTFGARATATIALPRPRLEMPVAAL